MDLDTAERPRSLLRPWLLGLTAVAALAIGTVAVLWHLHADALSVQSRELRLLALALSDEIDRGLQGVREGLQAIRDELRDGRISTAGADAQRSLHTRAELLPLATRLWLVRRDGLLVSASDPFPLPDLDSFRPLLTQAGREALSLSSTFRDTVDPKERMVAVAMACDSGIEGQGGWIVAAMPMRSLLGAFSRVPLAPDARMAVYRDDGVPLVLSSSPTAGLVSDASGDRLVDVEAIAQLGVRVELSRDRHAVLAAWRRSAQLTGVTLLLLLAGLALALHRVQRADARRAQAQAALSAQMARASKLEALGTLAGGVAHDFNNVLAGIVGYTEMAQDESPDGSDQRRHLETVMQAALRGRALCERILAFSRGGASESVPFELQPVVEEALDLLAASLRPGVVIERELDAGGALVRGDATRAFEATMNLCTNAMQALRENGLIGVMLRCETVDAPRVLSHSRLGPGRYVVLGIRDDGVGMSPQVLERLFEPFFTTRRAESGTGLGLAVVHGVMADFRGAIDVRSAPGEGSSFTLYFPQAQPAATTQPSSVAAGTTPGRGEQVLVVDDEPDLVAMTERMLRGLGYRTAGFHDPQAALQAVRTDPGRFAAVVTDELMPGLSGTQLTQALRLTLPQLPVLMVSGCADAELSARAAAVGVTRLLGKPLLRAELAQALERLLRH